MLLKRLAYYFTKRANPQSFSYKASAINPDNQSIDSLRNIDYLSLRRSVIEAFNQKIKDQNNEYKIEMDTVSKIDNDEGDEYSKKMREHVGKINGITREFNKKLKEIEEQEKTNTVKLYLAQSISHENVNTPRPSSAVQPGFYIPNRLVLKKLHLGSLKETKAEEDPSKQVLLIGVESQEEHCLFLAKIMEQFEVKQLVTMVPPDMPYFIKTQGSFLQEWKKFIEDSDYARKTKFYVNPKPKVLDDVCLHSRHFSLVREALGKSSSFIDTYYYLLKENQIDGKFQPLPLLAGLCSQHLERMYMGDFPAFQERKMLADTLSIETCRSLFQQFLANFKKLRLQFSAQWLFPPQVMRTKLSHITRIAKAVAQQGKGRTVLLCPAEMAELVSIQWQLARQSSVLNSGGNIFLEYSSDNAPEQTFMEHIQKLVILDMIIDPIISRYFTQYRSFPFMCEHTLGGRENIGKIFVVWTHFYNNYHKQLSERVVEDRESKSIRRSFMQRYVHPTDF